MMKTNMYVDYANMCGITIYADVKTGESYDDHITFYDSYTAYPNRWLMKIDLDELGNDAKSNELRKNTFNFINDLVKETKGHFNDNITFFIQNDSLDGNFVVLYTNHKVIIGTGLIIAKWDDSMINEMENNTLNYKVSNGMYIYTPIKNNDRVTYHEPRTVRTTRWLFIIDFKKKKKIDDKNANEIKNNTLDTLNSLIKMSKGCYNEHIAFTIENDTFGDLVIMYSYNQIIISTGKREFSWDESWDSFDDPWDDNDADMVDKD